MGVKPCILVNSNDQDHISDDFNHPEFIASPNDCRNPVFSSLIGIELLLTAGEAAKLRNGSLGPKYIKATK